MLDRFYVNPVLPAQDGDRARSFYRDVLGLKLLSSATEDPMMFQAGAGSAVVVTELPERVPPDYPVVSFLVNDIEAVVGELRARGVEFRNYGSASYQGQEGVVDGDVTDYGPVKSAWFRDTEGNVLALTEILSGF